MFDRCFDPAGRNRQMMAIIASGSRTTALGRVRLPTLVVHGDADTLVDQAGVAARPRSFPVPASFSWRGWVMTPPRSTGTRWWTW